MPNDEQIETAIAAALALIRAHRLHCSIHALFECEIPARLAAGIEPERAGVEAALACAEAGWA